MLKWFHHLFNPHCVDCADEKACRSCERLESLLMAERVENKRLLDAILNINKPPSPVIQAPMNLEELKPKFVPWRIKQQELEREDREAAKLLKDKQKDIESLEKELEINQNQDQNQKEKQNAH